MTSITKKVKISGVGIHSGVMVNMVVKPSKKPGIFLKRIDLNDSNLIPATFDNVGETLMRNTTIGNKNGAHVQTIEHLMAALFLLGIDSVIIEIDGKETPILDGSAYEFYNILKDVVDKKTQMKFGKMIEEYVANRKELKEVFMLIDFRHKPSEDDILMYKYLKYYNLKVKWKKNSKTRKYI